MSNPARVELEPAYVLHTRAYRETSQIVEVFTAGYGRIALVARGARRPKSRLRGILNPFQPLRMSWSGKGEMATLRDAEPGGVADSLTGDTVLAGFYVNELLLKFLQRGDPHPDLFAHYSSLVATLSTDADIEPPLRCFELQLLYEIGYALNLEYDAGSNEPLEPESLYEFHAEQGAVKLPATATDTSGTFTGAELLAIGRGELDTASVQAAAKRLLRNTLNYYLGDRGLQTRRVAASMRRS